MLLEGAAADEFRALLEDERGARTCSQEWRRLVSMVLAISEVTVTTGRRALRRNCTKLDTVTSLQTTASASTVHWLRSVSVSQFFCSGAMNINASPSSRSNMAIVTYHPPGLRATPRSLCDSELVCLKATRSTRASHQLKPSSSSRASTATYSPTWHSCASLRRAWLSMSRCDRRNC